MRKSSLKTTRTWWWRAAGVDESYISPMKTVIYIKVRSKSYFGGRKEIYMNIFMLTEKNGKINILMRVLAFSSGFEDVFFPVPRTFQNECNCT